LLSAVLAADRSFASREARIALSAVRNFERICRLCSRRVMFCRFAFRADFVRLATVFDHAARGAGVLSLLKIPGLTKGLL
jgi:hypothetical protein